MSARPRDLFTPVRSNARKAWTYALGLVMCSALTTSSWCQKINNFDRERAQSMMEVIASDIKKHYYDPKLHGLDWDNKVREAKQRIDQADSLNRALSELAALLDSLNDSHTYFLPPQHAYRYDYGWRAQMVGERCYVTHVRPGSDAESKGMKAGDEIVAINGYSATKDNFRKMEYVFNTLRPQPGLHFNLRDPAGKERALDVTTKVTEFKRIRDLSGDSGAVDIWDLIREGENQEHAGRARMVELGEDLMILKFPGFFFSQNEVESMLGKARKHKGLILDLRDNGGGSVDTLDWLLGGMFDKEVKIGDRVGRSEHKPMVAKPRGHGFEGKLVVLVDSGSASASELFARVVQIEKRGTVFGDLSSGLVMEAKRYSYKGGTDIGFFYGASITDADIVMTDGKSLEHVGVTPDQRLLPSAADVASGRDPVLAKAAEFLGVKLSPEDAGKMFPFEWPVQ